MDSFLIVEGEDINFIWDTIQEQQLVFHPTIAPDGKINFEKFYESKTKKPFILFIDRNILSSLLKLCEIGSLKDKGESQIVGLILTWAEMNNISVSAGLAVKERASQLNSQEAGLVELQKFLEAYNAHPGQLWLQVAEGRITEIMPITYSGLPAKNITVDYAEGGDHYDMAVASLLHVVQLIRNKNLTAAEKTKEFFQWMYDNLLVSEYLFVYAIMLFTGQEGAKAPKHANSDDIEKVIAGCENQAWDIAYLTNWSTLYSDTDKYAEEFLLATNDILLKHIFIMKNSPYGYNGLLFDAFSKKEYNQIMDYIEEKMKKRVRPDFGEDSHAYFTQLINDEKQQLSLLIEGK